MAKTGYGKRLAGDEDPHTEVDFGHLYPRDAEIATLIDYLPDGSAMGYKAIAAEHPDYGQQAVRTSLRRLTEAGHLRWIKEHLTVEDNSMRWVTRTYWSRTRRSEAWWAEFVRARHGRDVTHEYQPGLARVTEPAPDAEPEAKPDAEPQPEAQPQPEAKPDAQPQPQPQPTPTPKTTLAYRTLAQLRAADPRMALSEADCKRLEPSAAEWLARGASPDDITRALTAGLPPTITNPGGLARNRLENKMPPKPPAKTRPRARVTRAVMICGLCEEPETSVQLINGICVECSAETETEPCDCEHCRADAAADARRAIPNTFLARPRPAPESESEPEVVDVTERIAELRRAAGLPAKPR
ncbi:hypothetical protein AB0O76_21235 [Streptomyces sp. NPDC086554]|uniref:hypothetical protein n=1 Tax=Streptomyces sp. NPDC086554 TaxID=3154864 RepID=UPI00343EE6F1